MPSYDRTIKYLFSLESLGFRPGLKRIRALLRELGDPHLSYRTVHVAGTNGKGSTSAMIEAVLTEAGYRTGLYTSPHLERFNERIRISRKLITDTEVVEVADAVRRASGKVKKSAGAPTFFEFTTAMALLYFKVKGVQIAVIETGMGGRLDATNVIRPLLSVITNIGLDHSEHLGDTLVEVAGEKAGIIKRATPVVTGEEGSGPLEVIKKASGRMGAGLYILGHDFSFRAGRGGISAPFDYQGVNSSIKGLRLNLPGAHQMKNAALALTAAYLLRDNGFFIPDGAVRAGLKKVLWPGRLEIVMKRPLVILDGAHNPDGAAALKEALRRLRFRRLILVLGIMADKDIGGILKPLAPIADVVIFTAPATPRAAPARLLLEMLKPYSKPALVEDTVALACKKALSLAKPKDAVCITGSFFTIGEAKKCLAKAS